MLKIFLQTYGCQMNKLDTALVTSALQKAGFSLTEDPAQADIILLNTCSVRKHAEEKVLSHLGHLKHIKETKPELIVGVMGCMAQRIGVQLLQHQAVDIVCGPGQIAQIVELIKEASGKKEKKIAVTEKIREAVTENKPLEDFETNFDAADSHLPNQAFVSITRGCNNFCSYCIVPYVRGPEVSRQPGVILEQIKRLTQEGVKLL